MIKLNQVAKQAIYTTSPYYDKIDLTLPEVRKVVWSKDGQQGYLIAYKNNKFYKIALFQNEYDGHDDLRKLTLKNDHKLIHHISAVLKRVGTHNFKFGFILNLKEFDA